VRDAWTRCEPPRDLHHSGFQLGCRHHPVHHAEAQRLLHVDPVGQQVELPGLGRTDELGQQVGAAIVAGKADFREGRGHRRGVGGNAHVAGKGEREPGAGRGTGQRCDGRFAHLIEPERGRAVRLALFLHAQEWVRRAAGSVHSRHGLDVAARTERTPSTRENDAADFGIELGRRQLACHGIQHVGRQRIAKSRPVEGEDEHTIFAADEKILGFR
jgi:hypothetical protein